MKNNLLSKLTVISVFLNIVKSKWNVIDKTNVTQVYSLTREAYNKETKTWAFVTNEGVILLLERSGIQRPIFLEKIKIAESVTPETKTAITFYKSGSKNYVVTAAADSKKLAVFDPENPGNPVVKEILSGATSEIYSLFQIPDSQMLITGSEGTAGLKKWDIETGLEEPNSLSVNSYSSVWKYAEDNLIFGCSSADTTGFIVDSSTMTVTTTLSNLAGAPSNSFRYKRSHPAELNTLIISTLTGDIELRDVSVDGSAALKLFPSSNTEILDFKIGIEGIQGTSYVLMCSISPYCDLSDPSTALSGSPLPSIKILEDLTQGALLGLAFQNEDEVSFFVSSQYNPQITRVGICGGDGCGICSPDYSECQTCSFGFETTDPETGAKICISECENKQIERLSTKLSKCVNCLTDYSEDRETCSDTTSFFLKEVSEGFFDPYSSLSLEVSFEKSSEHIPKLPSSFEWNFIFEVSVENLAQGESSHKFDIRKGKLLIDLNFTKTLESTTLKLKNTQNIIYTDPISGEAKLIFIDSEPSIPISAFPPISEGTIEGARATSAAITTSAEVLGNGGSLLGVIGIFLQIPILGIIVKFVLIFKILNRLRLININTGGILGIFLGNIYNLFEYGQADEGIGQSYKSKTRDKLDKYNVTITPLIDIPHIYYIYIIAVILEIIRLKIWQYAKSTKKMTKSDKFLVMVLEKCKFMIFTMFLLDLTLYTFNSISHHDITRPQDGTSIQSFIASNVIGISIISELIKMITLNRELKFLSKKKQLEKNIRDNGEILSVGGKNKRRRRPKNRDSELEIKYQSYHEFYSNGIKIEKMESSKIARYFNLISLIRLVSFEPILVTLQLIPKLQIGLILLIQLSICGLTLFATFKIKAFTNIFIKMQHLTFEILLSTVMAILFIMSFQTTVKLNSSNTWKSVQFICIFLICLTAITSIIVMLLDTYLKLKAYIQEMRKSNELKKKGLKLEIMDIDHKDFETGNKNSPGSGEKISISKGPRPRLKVQSNRIRRKSIDRLMNKKNKVGVARMSKFSSSGAKKRKKKLENRLQKDKQDSDPDSYGKLFSRGDSDDKNFEVDNSPLGLKVSDKKKIMKTNSKGKSLKKKKKSRKNVKSDDLVINS